MLVTFSLSAALSITDYLFNCSISLEIDKSFVFLLTRRPAFTAINSIGLLFDRGGRLVSRRCVGDFFIVVGGGMRRACPVGIVVNCPAAPFYLFLFWYTDGAALQGRVRLPLSLLLDEFNNNRLSLWDDGAAERV